MHKQVRGDQDARHRAEHDPEKASADAIARRRQPKFREKSNGHHPRSNQPDALTTFLFSPTYQCGGLVGRPNTALDLQSRPDNGPIGNNRHSSTDAKSGASGPSGVHPPGAGDHTITRPARPPTCRSRNRPRQRRRRDSKRRTCGSMPWHEKTQQLTQSIRQLGDVEYSAQTTSAGPDHDERVKTLKQHLRAVFL